MTTKKDGAAQRVSLPTSEHRIPVGSKAMRQTTGSKWILGTLTLDMLYANPKGTEVPECRCKPQPQENGEQRTSGKRQRPASKAV